MLVFRKQLVCKRSLQYDQYAYVSAGSVELYLKSASHAEDPVVRFFRGKTLEGELDDRILFRDEIIGSVGR